MAGFPSSTGSTPLTLDAGLSAARDLASQVKSQSSTLASMATSSGIAAQMILAYATFLGQSNAALSQYAALSGMASYAQAQLGNASLNVSAAFTAMQSAISATLAWIITNFPHDANGNLLYVQMNAQGALTYTVFTPAQLAGFLTQLNALIATID